MSVTHGLAIRRDPNLPTGRPPLIDMARWTEVAQRARAGGASWAGALEEELATIEQLTLAAAESFQHGAGLLLRSHGEIDQRNTLLTVDGPCLLDWDGLLYSHPTAELAGAALNWAGLQDRTPHLDPTVAAAVVDAYKSSAATTPPVESFRNHASYWITGQLGWLWNATGRALGDDVPPITLEDTPDQDIPVKLALLHDASNDLDTWLADLDDS